VENRFDTRSDVTLTSGTLNAPAATIGNLVATGSFTLPIGTAGTGGSGDGTSTGSGLTVNEVDANGNVTSQLTASATALNVRGGATLTADQNAVTIDIDGAGINISGTTGDVAYHNGTSWQALDQTNLVAGDSQQLEGQSLSAVRSGVTKSDVGLSNVPNTDATDASNITSGTLSEDRLPGSVLDPDTVDGYGGHEIAILEEDETITGAWNFERRIKVTDSGGDFDERFLKIDRFGVTGDKFTSLRLKGQGNNNNEGVIIQNQKPGNSTVEIARFTYQGKVGINESSPNATLDVGGDAAIADDLDVGRDIKMDGGQAWITTHDGYGNFNILSGVDRNNTIVAGNGGTRLQLQDDGLFTVKILSGSKGSSASTAANYSFSAGALAVEDRIRFESGGAPKLDFNARGKRIYWERKPGSNYAFSIWDPTNANRLFTVMDGGIVDLQNNILTGVSRIKGAKSLSFNNTEVGDHSASDGFVYYDRNHNKGLHANRGGLVLYNAEDGWGGIIDTNNMTDVDAEFRSITLPVK
jgi:hypothetical protein